MLKKALTYSTALDFLQQHFSTAKNLYINRDYTARQLAEHLKVVYDNNFQKACIKAFGVKGKGLGGARMGSGNKKDGRERRRKKSDYETITIALPQHSINFLKSQKTKYALTIEKALIVYSKGLKVLQKDK